MDKKLLIFLPIIALFFAVAPVFSLEETLIEDSDPYIFLLADRAEVKSGDQITFTITYGNNGPDIAQSLKIAFNQPLDGRSVLELVSSKPEPDRWVTSEYGNLAEYFFEELKLGEEAEQEITILVKVRNSTPPQRLFLTANLQAPKREIGKRLITSEPVNLVIGNLSEAAGGESTAAATPSGFLQPSPSDTFPTTEPKPTVIADNKAFSGFNSGLLPKAVLLVSAVSLLMIGFLAGRKSSGN